MSSPCYDYRYLEALTDALDALRIRLGLEHVALFDRSFERPCLVTQVGKYPMNDAPDDVPLRRRFQPTLVDAGRWTLTAVRRIELLEWDVVDELLRFAARIEPTMWRMLGDSVDLTGHFARWRECGGRVA